MHIKYLFIVNEQTFIYIKSFIEMSKKTFVYQDLFITNYK